MKKILIILLLSFSFIFIGINRTQAQCSVCTKTAAQLGEEPARGLNAGIIYLALTPFAIFGVIAYRWWRRNEA
jgi:hypothetical protein